MKVKIQLKVRWAFWICRNSLKNVVQVREREVQAAGKISLLPLSEYPFYYLVSKSRRCVSLFREREGGYFVCMRLKVFEKDI